ncbi:MAG: hypothetical protein JWO86_8798 [Myxococcaceae bacterium]|nr:hypothetical protein [Myxococcaceae bacterium]MEA2753075.1 hypothetical protein [Myxococcales bacterium]
MPLDEATRRFAFLLQRDLRRITDRREQQEARGDVLKFDSVSRIAVVQSRRGESIARLFGEILATYEPHDRILRWAWAGRSSSAPPTHGDVVFREGQSRGVPQLSMSVVGDLDFEDAKALVELGALVARAEGIHERIIAGNTEFIALFDRPRPSEAVEPARESRFSVPPPPVHAPEKAPDAKAPPARAYRSIPPIREIFEPRTGSSPPRASSGSMPPPSSVSSPPPPSARGASASSSPSSPPVAKKLQEPSRALFLPVANAALAALTRGSKSYLQGLFVVTLDRELHASSTSDKRRLVVQLVVIDAAGILRALDPPADVVEAAATMVEADRREGNGQWRKLSARITPKPDGGATLHVDVT